MLRKLEEDWEYLSKRVNPGETVLINGKGSRDFSERISGYFVKEEISSDFRFTKRQ
ncbi:hypothetical protein QQ008_08045 [Fulvivirgaceae bacterium BMA10]|uniref:Uncharacterized protein n=1 Tax=Splendidivirga corallicola TaxID=3051826 RepID=A0ABT8KM46_9BACT|nr:hypothetical protein [Fulvivirgaceae bacterium BMA10]